MKKFINPLILMIFASLWGQSTVKIADSWVDSKTGTVQGIGQGNSPTFVGEILSGVTASTAAAFNGSKQLVSVMNTGTGNNVLATSPTIVAPMIIGVTSAPSLTANSGIIRMQSPNTGLNIGIYSVGENNGTWMQSTDTPDTTGLAFNLYLNPLGGNIGIGNLNPTKTLDVTGTLGVSGTTTLASSLNGCLTSTSGVVSSTGSACGSGGSADSTFGALFLTGSSHGTEHWRNGDSLYWDSTNSINTWSKGLKVFGDLHATGNVVSDNGMFGVNIVGSGTVSSGSAANILQGDGSGSLANGSIIWSADGELIQGPNTGLDIGNQSAGAAFGFTRICGADTGGISGACIIAQGSAYGGLGNGGNVSISLPSTGSTFPQFSINDANYGTNPIFAYNQFGDNGITIESQAFNISSTSGNILAWSDGNPFEVESPFQMDGSIQATVMIGGGKSGWCTDASGNAYRGTLVTVATIANVLTCP